MNFYEESINVPFIISWKGHSKAGVIDSKTLLSSGLDLYPTICALAGVSYDESLPGEDVSLHFLENTSQLPESREYIVSEINQSTKDENGKIVLQGRMVVSEKYKYFLFDGGKNREQLFDLENDPGEMNPVTNSLKYKKQLLAHRQMLKDWIYKTSDTFSPEIIPE
jgi:arylsulfatase A-like enzyme